jgi:hypothetical protein
MALSFVVIVQTYAHLVFQSIQLAKIMKYFHIKIHLRGTT